MIRQDWIDKTSDVAVSRQCVLVGVSRTTLYAHQKPMQLDGGDALLKGLIDGEYTRHPFYGTRSIRCTRTCAA